MIGLVVSKRDPKVPAEHPCGRHQLTVVMNHEEARMLTELKEAQGAKFWSEVVRRLVRTAHQQLQRAKGQK